LIHVQRCEADKSHVIATMSHHSSAMLPRASGYQVHLELKTGRNRRLTGLSAPEWKHGHPKDDSSGGGINTQIALIAGSLAERGSYCRRNSGPVFGDKLNSSRRTSLHADCSDQMQFASNNGRAGFTVAFRPHLLHVNLSVSLSLSIVPRLSASEFRNIRLTS